MDQGFGLMINTLPFADSNDKIIDKTKSILRRRIPKITSPNQCQSRTSGADKTFGRTKSVPYAGTAYDESQFRTTD